MYKPESRDFVVIKAPTTSYSYVISLTIMKTFFLINMAFGLVGVSFVFYASYIVNQVI